MPVFSYAAFLAVLLLANTVQTITGFAGNLLAMPPGIRLVGPATATAVVNIFTMVACLIITIKNRRFLNAGILAKMVCLMLLGMAAGRALLAAVEFDLLLRLYGVMILAIAANQLLFHVRVALPKALLPLVLVAAGVVHGMFLSGGALLVVYAVTVLKDKDEFRATVAPVWVILDAVLILPHYLSGYYTPENLRLILAAMVPLGLSLWAGGRLYGRIDQETFLKLTYGLLLFAGVVAVV